LCSAPLRALTFNVLLEPLGDAPAFATLAWADGAASVFRVGWLSAAVEEEDAWRPRTTVRDDSYRLHDAPDDDGWAATRTSAACWWAATCAAATRAGGLGDRDPTVVLQELLEELWLRHVQSGVVPVGAVLLDDEYGGGGGGNAGAHDDTVLKAAMAGSDVLLSGQLFFAYPQTCCGQQLLSDAALARFENDEGCPECEVDRALAAQAAALDVAAAPKAARARKSKGGWRGRGPRRRAGTGGTARDRRGGTGGVV